MKSYIQGLITGGVLVFAMFVFMGANSSKVTMEELKDNLIGIFDNQKVIAGALDQIETIIESNNTALRRTIRANNMTYIDSDADMKVMISDIKSNIDIMFDYGVTCRQY